jgi:hypothetical protein
VIVFVSPPTGPRYAFIGDLTWQIDGIRRRAERAVADQQTHSHHDGVEKVRSG